jgi:hypothetical protein
MKERELGLPGSVGVRDEDAGKVGKTGANTDAKKTPPREHSRVGRSREGKSNSANWIAVAPHSSKVIGTRTRRGKESPMKQRGVFEKEPESGVWWIRYFDQFGKKRREKASTKSVAIKLYGKRTQQVLEGKTDVPRFASRREWFGAQPAKELTPKEIEHKLSRVAEEEKWAPLTFNHYRSLMSLSYRLGILNRKVISNPARSVTHRREDNDRVRFLTVEEEKKLRNVIDAKWSSHVPELDLAINRDAQGQSIRSDVGHGRLQG